MNSMENDWNLYHVSYEAPGGAGMGFYKGFIDVWAESPEDAEARALFVLTRRDNREIRIVSVG